MKVDALVEGGLKEIGPRVSLVGLLPTLVLFGFISALVAAGAPRHAPRWQALRDAARTWLAEDTVLLIAALLLLSLVLHPLQRSLVRLFEGYWPPALGALAAWGTKRQALRRAALEQALRHEGAAAPDAATLRRMQSAAAALQAGFPRAERLLPTALGNALRAAEDRPLQVYRLDGVAVWPRLYPLLPETMRDVLGDARLQLDTALRSCAVFVVAGMVSAALLWRHGAWLLLSLGCLLLARLAYAAGVQAASSYGQCVVTAFDLYRFSLHTALHLPLPANAAEEHALNEQVSALLRQGGAPSVAYAHPPPGKDS
jgi:hypothetical protein